MPLKTKKIIITILALTVSLAGVFWIFKERPSNTNIIQNISSEPDQTNEGTTSGSKETKLLFATKGGRDVYKIRRDDKWVISTDGQESMAYDNVTNPTFSADGQKFAYSAYLDNQTYLVINNNPQAVFYKQIVSITFSPDGNRLAYVAGTGEKSLVVLDNQAGKEYQQIGTLETDAGNSYVIFSPDSQNIAYKVVTDSGAFIVVNEQAGKTYDDVSNFQFSNDSQQFAYQAENNNQQLTVVNNNKVIVNNTSTTTSTTTTPTTTTQPSSTSSNNNNFIPSTSSVGKGGGVMPYILNCTGSSGLADCAK